MVSLHRQTLAHITVCYTKACYTAFLLFTVNQLMAALFLHWCLAETWVIRSMSQNLRAITAFPVVNSDIWKDSLDSLWLTGEPLSYRKCDNNQLYCHMSHLSEMFEYLWTNIKIRATQKVSGSNFSGRLLFQRKNEPLSVHFTELRLHRYLGNIVP